MFAVGTKVRKKLDGAEGLVVSADEKEIVVKFEGTGKTMNSPWGEFVDTGSEGHYKPQFAARLIEAI